MKIQDELRRDFYSYLAGEFGDRFLRVIQPPHKVKVGERVPYVLRNDQEAQRKDLNEADFDEVKKIISVFSRKTGGAVGHLSPPITSDLPYPRIVDIIDLSEVGMDLAARRYLNSSDLLSKVDFSILWLFGVVFFHSSKRLVYIDFTHPKVKAAFSVEYDVEHDFETGRNMKRQLDVFKAKCADLVRPASSRPDVMWSRLPQLDDELLVKIKTERSMFSHTTSNK